MQLIFDDLRQTTSDSPVRADTAAVLRAIHERRSELDAWRHPLGFVHVELTPLVTSAVGERFRLHIWDNSLGTIDDLGDLHDHVWSLKSWVMLGELVDTTYSPVSEPAGAYRGSRVRYGTTNTAQESGRYNLNILKERRIGAGNKYIIDQGTVHSSSPFAIPTVTLLVSVEDADAARLGPLVFSRMDAAGFATAVRVKLTAEELARALDSCIDLLDSGDE